MKVVVMARGVMAVTAANVLESMSKYTEQQRLEFVERAEKHFRKVMERELDGITELDVKVVIRDDEPGQLCSCLGNKCQGPGYDEAGGETWREVCRRAGNEKEAPRNSSPFVGNCPDCSRPLPESIGDCITGACKRRSSEQLQIDAMRGK